MAQAKNTTQGDQKLGAFLGVFTPTILTILGVIMYLRFGWLLGHMGLYHVILVVVLANIITLITTLSFSSVATNSRIGVGGAYFIVSRSLGLEIGGAIGLPLFLSQAFSVTLYSFGLAESLRFVLPSVNVQAVAFVIVIAVAALSLTGAKIALKSQIPVMILIGISLLALGIGAIYRFRGNVFPVIYPTGEVNFWLGFAIFFPAVTGVMAGLGLSGDLRDPERSIPIGAISACIAGFLIYLLVPVFLIIGASATELREDTLIWLRIAPLGPLVVLPGLWGAIFSSAVGSMLGAPRTLQALAIDRTVPHFFGKRIGGDGKKLVPGIVLTLGIALGAVFLGDLNAVAPVVTVFFLTTYGVINIVAALETLSNDASWRPKLRVPWPVNLMGGIACLAVVFLINPLAGIIAIVAELTIWLLLSRRESTARWGDARRGIYETLIRWALIRLSRRPMSARNWRPHVLVFVSDPIYYLDLIRFGNWFSQERGVVTVCQLVVGDLMDKTLDLISRHDQMQRLLKAEGLVLFPELNVVRDVVEGIISVTQANGMAGFQSNTVLLGWPKERKRFAEFLQLIRRLEQLKKSLIIGRIQHRYLFPREGIERTIHVWWGGMQHNGDLMLLLAYLLTLNPEWSGARIQIMSIASNELMKAQTEHYLTKLLPEIRIKAEQRVFVKPKDKSVRDLIHAESSHAAVVLFGLATPEEGEEEAYAQRLEDLAGDLPTVFFVKNSSMFIGGLLQPNSFYGQEEDSPDEKAFRSSS